MKKIIAILFLLLTMLAYTNAQVAWRVVAVSPNYPNVYPRYSTLQQTWNALKDSASVTTGKYFLINIATATQNITDYSSTYKDSILNRSPYMGLIQLSKSVNDSIIGVATGQFLLTMGVLYIDPTTAGNGLNFNGDKYNVNAVFPLQSQADSIRFNYSDSLFQLYGGTNFTLRRSTNAGWFITSSGLQIRVRYPFYWDNDTLDMKLESVFYVNADSLCFGYDHDAFIANYGVLPSFSFRADSGLIVPVGGNGVKVIPDYTTIGFNTSKKLTINSAIWGDGLSVSSGIGQVNVLEPLSITSDTVRFGYLPQHFGIVGGNLVLLVDSGLVANTFPSPSKPKVSLDWITLTFTTGGALQVASTIAGAGIQWLSGIMNIVTNDFASVSADTVKIRTSTILWYKFDSLTTLVAYDKNADTVGYGMASGGKIKRITLAYKTDAGNDTTVYVEASTSFNKQDRIAMKQQALGTGFTIAKNGLDVFNISLYDLTTPYHRRINVGLEIWLEAL